MKINSKLLCSFAVGALSLVLVKGAHAQGQAGLVNVDLTNVDIAIADDINIDVSQIPLTVQAPIGIAANVCDVSANVLAADIRDDGVASCNAETTSQALNQIVQRKVGDQN